MFKYYPIEKKILEIVGDFTNLKSFHIKKHPSIQQAKKIQALKVEFMICIYLLIYLLPWKKKRKTKKDLLRYSYIVHVPNDLPI